MDRIELNGAKDLGLACRKARKRLGMRLEDAALAGGVSYRFASEIENGKETARIELAIRYAKALGIALSCTLPTVPADMDR